MLEWKRILICFIIICIVGGIIGYFVYINNNTEENNEIKEYVPQEEISSEQIRYTTVMLYFKDESGIIPEARLIDVKKIIDSPYEELVNLLVKGPKDGKLKKTIPENTKINKIEKNGEIITIDFSKEFIENHIGGEKEENNTIKSIVYTLTQLLEINGVKIKVEGKENCEFKDGVVKFDKIFYRD